MKKLLLTIGIAAVMTGGVYAQGRFSFANATAGVNAPIYSTVGGLHLIPTGTMYSVGYYWGLTGATGANGLLTGGTFGTPTVNPSVSPDYFLGGLATIAGQNGTVFIQPVVWTTASGSLTSAMVTPGAEWGAFNPVSVTLATGIEAPPNLFGLAPLTLEVAPEPATTALVGFGAAGLLWFRRRNKIPRCSFLLASLRSRVWRVFN